MPEEIAPPRGVSTAVAKKSVQILRKRTIYYFSCDLLALGQREPIEESADH